MRANGSHSGQNEPRDSASDMFGKAGTKRPMSQKEEPSIFMKQLFSLARYDLAKMKGM